jgi:hypothetical protein
LWLALEVSFGKMNFFDETDQQAKEYLETASDEEAANDYIRYKVDLFRSQYANKCSLAEQILTNIHRKSGTCCLFSIDTSCWVGDHEASDQAFGITLELAEKVADLLWLEANQEMGGLGIVNSIGFCLLHDEPFRTVFREVIQEAG